MHFDLILNVAFNIHHQEIVTLMDQLLIKRVIDWVPINSVLYEKHRQIFNAETAKQPLIFFIWDFFFFIEEQKVFFVDFWVKDSLLFFALSCAIWRILIILSWISKNEH